MKKMLIMMLLTVFVLSGNVFALNTFYENQQGYDVNMGYNNKIPYKAFFDVDNPNSPKPENKNVQKYDRFGNVIQAVVPVNERETKVEQKGLEK